jgi:hypothetical protein
MASLDEQAVLVGRPPARPVDKLFWESDLSLDSRAVRKALIAMELDSRPSIRSRKLRMK